MNKRSAQPQTPGDTRPPETDEIGTEVEQPETEQSFSDEDEARIQAEVERRLRASQALKSEAFVAPTSAKALPDISEIDPKKITRAVQTKQGWVCPHPPEKAPDQLR